MINTEVVFPLSVTFEDGSVEQYESVEDLAANLENFDSDIDVGCRVDDNLGRPRSFKVKAIRSTGALCYSSELSFPESRPFSL